MKLPRRQFLHLAAGAAALPAVSRIATAQSYPSRPITIIVPYAAGGPTDTVGRVMAERMRDLLGQPVVVENVTGAAGSIGTGRAAPRAAPDGYTLSLGDVSTHVVNGAVRSLQYDVLNDFEPVCLLAISPLLIVGRKTMPATTCGTDRVAEGKPGQGLARRCRRLFSARRLLFPDDDRDPFPGRALPRRRSGCAGHGGRPHRSQVSPASVALASIRGGDIKAFAIAAKSRLKAVPSIPTVDEAGLPGFHISVWQAFWAPRARRRTLSARSMPRS